MWRPQLLLLLLRRNNSQSVNIHCVCVYVCCHTVKSSLERSHYSSSCIYCVSSLLCHSPDMCHDTDPVNLQRVRGRLILIRKSWRKVWKCDNKQRVLEKMAVRWCHIKDPSEQKKEDQLLNWQPSSVGSHRVSPQHHKFIFNSWPLSHVIPRSVSHHPHLS